MYDPRKPLHDLTLSADEIQHTVGYHTTVVPFVSRGGTPCAVVMLPSDAGMRGYVVDALGVPLGWYGATIDRWRTYAHMCDETGFRPVAAPGIYDAAVR